MAWPRVHIHSLVAVVLLPLVFIHDFQTNWRAQCDAKLGARLYLYTVLLVSRCGYGRLARSAARHLGLDVVVCESHAWRAPVDNGADGKAVRLAIAGARSVFTSVILEICTYVVTLKCVPNVDIIVWCCGV